MKQFTIYQIEKMTNGKLSKYKLEKAIEDGVLEATFQNVGKGRGAAKYRISEDAIHSYLASEYQPFVSMGTTKASGKFPTAQLETMIEDMYKKLLDQNNQIRAMLKIILDLNQTSIRRRQIIKNMLSLDLSSFPQLKQHLLELSELG